jgi:hypothetical protein
MEEGQQFEWTCLLLGHNDGHALLVKLGPASPADHLWEQKARQGKKEQSRAMVRQHALFSCVVRMHKRTLPLSPTLLPLSLMQLPSPSDHPIIQSFPTRPKGPLPLEHHTCRHTHLSYSL